MAGSGVGGNQLRDLKAQLEKLSGENHSERLCVAESASKREIRTAFLGLAKRYHPHRFSHRGKEHERLANEIFLVVKEAHDVLLTKVAGDAAKPKRRTSPPPSQTGRQTTVRFRSKTKGSSEAPNKSAPVRPLVTPSSDEKPTNKSPVEFNAARKMGTERLEALREAAKNNRKRPKSPGKTAIRMAPLSLEPEPEVEPKVEPKVEPEAPADHSGLVAKLESAEEKNLVLYRSASKLLREGRAAEARDAFRKLAVANPTEKRYRTYMHFSWGREHELAGRRDEAATEYQRALNVNPRFTPALEALEALQALSERPGVLGRLFRGRQK